MNNNSAKNESDGTGLSSDMIISDDHLINVCKYRRGSMCCKYIVFFESHKKFYCVKNILELKKKIDLQSSQLRAKGDNCIGLPDAER